MDSIWTDLQTDEWANRQTDGRMDRLQIMSILGNRNRLNRSRTVPEPFLNRNRPDQRFGAVRFSQFGLNRVGPNRNRAGPNRGNTSGTQLKRIGELTGASPTVCSLSHV